MLGGETLLARVIRLANEAGAAPVLAVLGAQHNKIRANVALNDADVVINENWEQGIATSIHEGVKATNAAAPGISGVLILSCDQPRLTAAHLRTLIESFNAQLEPTIAASSYAGVIGIPAIFPRSLFPDLFALSGDKGARALLNPPPCSLIAQPFEGGEVDIDLPADLGELE
jgi:CTP:molybdopterin cytidylyltransferase MocA